MSLWDALRMNMMISYQELVRTFPNETAKSFSEMNEHEKAAVVHEKANNGQSSVIHQQQAEKHRSQITQN